MTVGAREANGGITAVAVILAVTVFLSALLIGWALSSSPAPAAASHGTLINARVAQDVDNHGVSATIASADPSINWIAGKFSYMRVIAQQALPHRYGEIGWYRGSYLTRSALKAVAVSKDSSGAVTRWVGPSISTSSTYTYKVVNNETCSGGATTLDNAWDFCYGTTKLITDDISLQTAPRFISGGEVGDALWPRNPHGVEMGPSDLTNNKYKPELPISSCLGPSNAPSSTRAIVVSLTDAVNHPIKLTKPSLGVVS